MNDAQPAEHIDRRSSSIPWWLFALAVAITLVPLLLAASPASCDYFMHLARVGIYMRQNLPLFQDAYHFRLTPIPNLGFDLVTPLFGRFLEIPDAGKAFIALTFVAQATGAAALGYAVHRRLTAATLLIPLLVYNLVLAWGFMGFLLGVGLALWGAATYILLEDRPVWIRSLVLAAFAVPVYFCHLAAFGLLVATLVFWELATLAQDPGKSMRPRLRGAAAVLAASLIPAYVHLFLSPVGQSVGLTWQSPGQWLGDLNTLLNPYRTPWLSVVHVGTLLGTLLLLLTRNLTIDRRLGWVALGLLLVYLATPFRLYGSAFANTRLEPYVAFVFFAALRTAPGRIAAQRWIAAGAVAMLVLQATTITMLWRDWSVGRAEMLSGASRAPRGTMFVSLVDDKPTEEHPPQGLLGKVLSRIVKDDPEWQPPVSHVTDEIATIGEYLPIQMYNTPAKQPVEIDDKYLDLYFRVNSTSGTEIAPLSLARFRSMGPREQLAAYSPMPFDAVAIWPERREEVAQLLALCDREYRQIRRASGIYPEAGVYVVYIHRKGQAANPLPRLLRTVSEGETFSVYEVDSVAAASLGRSGLNLNSLGGNLAR